MHTFLDFIVPFHSDSGWRKNFWFFFRKFNHWTKIQDFWFPEINFIFSVLYCFILLVFFIVWSLSIKPWPIYWCLSSTLILPFSSSIFSSSLCSSPTSHHLLWSTLLSSTLLPSTLLPSTLLSSLRLSALLLFPISYHLLWSNQLSSNLISFLFFSLLFIPVTTSPCRVEETAWRRTVLSLHIGKLALLQKWKNLLKPKKCFTLKGKKIF